MGSHGGFETVVSELAPRLAAEGLEVHCSSRLTHDVREARSFPGVTIDSFPLGFPESYSLGKAFELIYDSFFVIRCKFILKCDALFCFGIPSGPALLLTRFSRSHVAVNIDGLEWRREKFSRVERAVIKLLAFTTFLGSDVLILDNESLRSYLPKAFLRKATFITYGVTPIECRDWNSSLVTNVLGQNAPEMEPDHYLLVVARLEPENNIHAIIENYLKSSSAMPLVVVGGPSSEAYEHKLRRLSADPPSPKHVHFTGPIYDKPLLDMLRCHCRAYIHGHSVGGTNPSLLESMSAGNLIIAHDNAFNRSVCGDCALYFSDAESLRKQIDFVVTNPSSRLALGRAARLRSESNHSWDDVVAEYRRVAQGGSSHPATRRS